MPKIRVLIASEYPIVRTGLGKLLNGTRDFEVIAEVNLSDIVKAALELLPDVFLVELTEAGLAGLKATAALMRAVATAAVVVLSSNENPSYVRSQLAIGINRKRSDSVAVRHRFCEESHKGSRQRRLPRNLALVKKPFKPTANEFMKNWNFELGPI
jgi:DNA-binding NarL/FixJ family response regulator